MFHAFEFSFKVQLVLDILTHSQLKMRQYLILPE